MDTYVIYGHNNDNVCMQKNNDKFYCNNEISELQGNYRINVKEGESTVYSWDVTFNKTKGWWELTSTFEKQENIDITESILRSKLISEGKQSDDTARYYVDSKYRLEVTKI